MVFGYIVLLRMNFNVTGAIVWEGDMTAFPKRQWKSISIA